MSDLIMQLSGVIQRDIDTLNAVSQNVANANTTGYKAARAFSVLAPVVTSSDAPQGLSAIQTQTSISTEGGALQHTGKPTDLALAGDAWFALQTRQGLMLTRDGRFQVDHAGYLVSNAGYPVMGEDGPIQVTGGELKVDAAGGVRIDGQRVGQISLIRLNDPSALVAGGNGLYQPMGAWQPAEDYVVHQGMLERSNAAMGSDMVRIMEVSRHVESMQRALSAYDSMLNSGINQLGKE
jgi:flagellar basal-body rod protein FlgF